MSEQNEILVVIPTYNERENLPRITQALMGIEAVDFLVVDDNSPDGTGELAVALSEQEPRAHVLNRERKQGLGPAYLAGFRWALERKYRYIVEMDGDLSHDPKEIVRFRKRIENADLVLGTRYKEGIRVINWPLPRLLLSLAAAAYVRLVTGMPFSDPTGGFKMFRAEALKSIDLNRIRSNGYSFQIELTHTLWTRGYRVVEAPIIFTDRFQGSSKMSKSIVYEAVGIVWRLWLRNRGRRRPIVDPADRDIDRHA